MNLGRQAVRQLMLSTTIIAGLFLSGVLHVRAATAATYYVATTGNDANPGTPVRPFRTIRKGLSILRAGDTLYLRGGTYAETIDSNKQTIPHGTSWSDALVIASYPGETAVLAPRPGAGQVLNIADPALQYLIFDGLVIDATGNDFGISHGSAAPNPVHASHIRYRNGEVKNATLLGAMNGDYIEYINMRVHDNKRAHGWYITGSGNVVDGCDIYNNGGYGVQVYNGHSGGRANNNIIRNSIIHGNGTNYGSGQVGSGAGVTLASGDGNIAYNNIIYGNRLGIEVMWGRPTNTGVYNNTIYNNSPGPGIEIGSGSTGAVIKNNIVYQNGAGITDNGSTSTIQSTNLTTDPQFVNASAKDFTLQSTSPAIDAGTPISIVTVDFNGTPRPQGAKFDIGAYEYRGTQPPVPSNPRRTSVSP